MPTPNIFLSGISGSGKTTFLYKLKLNEIVLAIPTIGFNVESIQLWNNEYILWDFQCSLLKFYLQDKLNNIIGIIHLCRDGSDESKKSIFELINLLKNLNSNVPILVLMNSEEKNQPIPNNYAEDTKILIDYPGIVTFKWFSSFSGDEKNFLEENFLEMFLFLY